MTITLAQALDKIAAGDLEMTYGIGVAYQLGTNGVTRDSVFALGLLQAAAGRGHAGAFNSLGALHVGEETGIKDLPMAWACFNVAAALGDKLAGRNRAEVERLLSAEDLKTAREKSATWLTGLAKARVTFTPAKDGKKAASG